MSELTASDFAQFFEELHDRKPFPWQIELARSVCHGSWPRVIDLPTGSGKTACIDIALFALAVQGAAAPRRIFFVVDRRVIVSEAYERAGKIARKLERSERPMLARVSDRLKALSGGHALKSYELRGGAFRDEAWVESPLQPAVIASTVDQIGSRLLFRGYGVSQGTWPIHAGLIANDSLIFLDEAHCSTAFSQTLDAIAAYRSGAYATEPLAHPFHFVEMTATPSEANRNEQPFRISSSDRANLVFQRRLYAEKTTRLSELRCRKDDVSKFAGELIRQAVTLADEVDGRRIGIIVNRIATAKEVHRQLGAKGDPLLVIGRMRPLDRNWLQKEWQPFKVGAERSGDRRFMVSTQCLEVGADLDFDVLVSECASMDALQQRFGRLDRVGEFEKARGAIVAGTWQLSGKGDPVYGDALMKTWSFLNLVEADGVVQMGVERRDGTPTVSESVRGLSRVERAAMSLASGDAPLLLPSHLDALVQTSPIPEPEPFVEYFLHGKKNARPEVSVVWRSDLTKNNFSVWEDIVAICPPSSMEAMPVPLSHFRRWLAGERDMRDGSDLEGGLQSSEETEAESGSTAFLIWRGTDQSLAGSDPRDIYPGATVVLPTSAQGWNALGYKPEPCPTDRGEEARVQLRRQFSVRLHPTLVTEWPQSPARETLLSAVAHSEPDDLWTLLKQYPKEAQPDYLVDAWKNLDEDSISEYPDGSGWFVTGIFRNKEGKRTTRKVSLRKHTDDVVRAVDETCGDRLSAEVREALRIAAEYHDYGKVDYRYQAWLRNGDELAARYAREPLAKSGKYILKKQRDCGVPEHFRHEFLSLMFAERARVREPLRDLVLYLVAVHHGNCRPSAAVVLDWNSECVSFGDLSVCRKDRTEHAPHSLASGVEERFWRLTRRYGWWGMAYIESMLRLADWAASKEEGAEIWV